MTVESTGDGVAMCLPSDAISLPPQQPQNLPSTLVVLDEKEVDTSAGLKSEHLVSIVEGFGAIICEEDAKVVLDLLASDNIDFHPLGSLLMDIKEMLSWEWQCQCKHTLREGNFYADKLSKLGCELDEEFEVYRELPQQAMDAF
ncbi:hypothetical protein COLO4_20072 [Corchorus olitorius]|uniref:RNase H type-1 domain-containing protein n=1 Tax=Corchorus olitorius TaxID=93759 RepID=A0A1R3J1Y8_9ROSI|nr:hypothetical protein COLO4_20072 [Corchorus olitorius]